MKNVLLISFFSILLIASCQCNDGNDGMKDDTDTTAINEDVTSANSDEQSTDYSAQAEERMMLMFDRNNYTDEQIREYRKLHDEMDWGDAPGYYPEGSTRPLTNDDVKYLTEWGHSVMLNEIYARHGKIFQDDDLKEHFNTQDWYTAKHDNVQDMLTEIEKQNITFLNNNKPS